MRVDRREFLNEAVAGSAGVLLGGGITAQSAAAAESSISRDPTAWVPLGKFLTVPRIGIGFGVKSYNRESNLTRRGLEHADRIVRYAYDCGIRLFDNADLYGSHGYVAKALRGKPRDSYALISKVWFLPGGLPEPERQDAGDAVRRFLKELKTDYIDLVQIHCMTARNWTSTMRRQMDQLEELKEQGLIRAHGVSCHSVAALEAAAESDWVEVVHSRFNHLGTKMDDKPEVVQPVLQRIHDAGKGVIAMKVVGEGAFSKDPELREKALRFVMASGCVDVMIVGFELESEMDEFKSRVAAVLEERAVAV